MNGPAKANVERMKRVCLLTGASGALGTSFIRQYREHYDIVAVYRSRVPNFPSQERHLVDPLDPKRAVPENDNALFSVQADLLDDGACTRVAELALARFGRVDLVVNAAAVFARQALLGSENLVENFERQFRLNVQVPLLLSVTLADLFWRSRGAENAALNRHIVNVASIGGVRLYPGTGLSVYSASKAALVQLRRHMAAEFSDIGLRVNALAPSAFPRLILTDAVASSLRRLDESRASGNVVLIQSDGETLE
jgi:NAD(P)-dependent dehydrogenase (short-subunit alcohol dehydrogenase family)